MNILIRVDGSRHIGTGHVKRCQSLTHAVQAMGHEAHFVWRDQGLDLAPWFSGFASTRLPPVPLTGGELTAAERSFAGVSGELDARQTLEVAKCLRPDWIVVDHYAFDRRWHEIAAAGDWGMAAIDDLADRPLLVDVVIDQNYDLDHRRKYAAVIPDWTDILGGPTYAMLSPDYAGPPVIEVRPQVESIGIFMGGADSIDASSVALDALDKLGFGGLVEVVTTTANPQVGRLAERCMARGNTSLSVDLPSLAGFFSRHDLHIGAGGSATWERCRLGAPTVAVVCAENQRQVLHQLVVAGVQYGVDVPDSDQIAAAVATLLKDRRLRRQFAGRSVALVDGCGAARVAEYLAGRRARGPRG